MKKDNLRIALALALTRNVSSISSSEVMLLAWWDAPYLGSEADAGEETLGEYLSPSLLESLS